VSKRIGVLTAIVVLAFPALAGATIVVNKSIAGVSLGDTMTRVRHHLGAPSAVDHKGPGSSCLQATCWLYSRRKLLVGFGSHGRVNEVFTESPAQKTPGGIGTGSSRAAVLSHIRGVRCSHVPGFLGQECIVGVRHGSLEWTTDFHVGQNTKRGPVVVQNVLVNILSVTAGALDRAMRARL
jgi:hypothetical protein